MGQRANVSVCLIVRDEESSGIFEDCLRSIRPHVEEIVIVDTGSSDNTLKIAAEYADIVETFTECNDEDGRIANFAVARNRSFDLATKPWVMWMDSDDVIRGGENIARLVQVGEDSRGDRDWVYLFPYEYVYDPNGKCVCLHYRERLLSRRAAMQWVNPVHEVMIPTANAQRLAAVPCDDVVFEHWRQRSKKAPQGGRNLRILQKLVEQGGCEDARQWYYLGLEYANVQNWNKATEWLARYSSVSGWKDEKAMAELKLAEIAYAQDRPQEGIIWAARAMITAPQWGEGYFALARGHYLLAIKGPPAGDVRENWEKCAEFARTGLSKPPTKTMLFVNPVERELDIHVYLTMALSQLGDARGALRHADEAYKQTPNDPNLVYNRKIFQREVAREDIVAALNRLADAGGVDAETRDAMIRAVDGNNGTSFTGWSAFSRPAEYPRGVKAEHFPVARKAPHARAFALPESTDIDDLPVRMTDAQLESATFLIWKEYVLHDEILSAQAFLENAPYRVRDSVGIARALERTRNMTAWMNSPAIEQKVNTPENPNIENGVPLPGPLTGAMKDRADLVLATLVKGEAILDFGCFDGGIVNRWALEGHDVTGVDLCQGSIALAKRKAEEFNTGAKFWCEKFSNLVTARKYDVVTCCDTYEHVRDRVNELIIPAVKALKDDGRIVITTPHGSWMRGEFFEWAHPWRWGPDENRPWNTDLPHAHLVAPSPWSVAKDFRAAGCWVKDSYVVETSWDTPGQGNVFADARLQAPSCADPLDIIFACGDAWQNWNPLVHKEQGLGGSETMVVELAKRLSLAGHRVRVYTSTGKHGEGIFDGVEYRQSEHLAMAKECDVLVAWRNASLIDLPIKAKLRLLWVHDIWAGGATHKNLLKTDRILALSNWHKEFVKNHHNVADRHVRVTRNGIDLSRFDHDVERNPHRAIYSSSPDRGLPVLLDVWPRIRERVPDAELHVFYGFYNWRKAAEASGNQEQLDAIHFLMNRMVDLQTQGVRFRDKVSQAELAKEFLASGVWAYPTWFSETSCLTAMEAQAAGCRVVTSSIAALNETVGPTNGTLIDGDWLSPEYQEHFVDEVVRAMTCPEDEWWVDREESRERAGRDFGLDALAQDWIAMFREEMAILDTYPLAPYKGRADFVRITEDARVAA